MKRLLASVAVVLVSTAASFADTGYNQVSSNIASQVQTLVPGADLSNLTTAQYAQLVSLFSNSDNYGAGEDPAGQIKAILGNS
jgi:hypothetical protein